MTLTIDEIFDIILFPKNTKIIERAVKLKKHHELHLLGIGLDRFFEVIDKVENKDYIDLKKKLANAFTVTVYEKALRPKDRIFSGKGGSIIYEIKNDPKKKKENILRQRLARNLHKGLSLNQYMKKVWGDYGIWIDPLGMSFVEYDVVKGEASLEYISIYDRCGEKDNENGIFVNYHDISFNWIDEVEYVVFNEGVNDDGNNVFRVIDDEFDYIIIQDKEKQGLESISINTIDGKPDIRKNMFGQVPCVLNSSRIDRTLLDSFTTYCYESLILADNILNDYADYRIYKKKLGIPRFWEFKTSCSTCNGSKYIYTDDEPPKKIKCSVCKGTGEDKERNLTDIFKVDLLEKNVQSYIPPSGAVTLPVEIQQQMIEELNNGEKDLFDIIWGNGSSVNKENKNQTAFEISVKNEEMLSKFHDIAANMVVVKSKIISLFGLVVLQSDFNGVTINPPNQFVLATSTEALQLYLNAKKENAPDHILNKLYLDYLNAEYEQNPYELERQKIIMLLNPAPHKDISEVLGILGEDELLIKRNLAEYVYKYEQKGIINNDNIEEIKKQFKKYANESISNNGNRSEDNV